ncbi:hypothetical protein LPJ57_002574 [Coemansia sp. RSA 486]|nr:hypothetical protein LPJ57_002574 [Coemansia sp. RSA 486]KAJ2233569.1 hypothetical protein IWW45_004074 [Coemansia sp. RSA 485]
MEGDLQRNKILVLGRSEIDKLALVNTVVGEPVDKTPAGAETSAKVDWRIETRYFDAQVEFWIDSTEPLSVDHQEFMQKWLDAPDKLDGTDGNETTTEDIPIDDTMEMLQEQLSQVVDAIVFVFDPLDPDSFRDILPWARMARTHQPEVLMCVANGRQTDTESNDVSNVDKDRWFEWCISNGWEWVDLTDSDPETEHSIDRVREALISNQWQTMTMKNTQKPKKHSPEGLENTEYNDSSLMHSTDGPRPQGSKELAEWDAFDEVSRSIDAASVENLHQALFSHDSLQPKRSRSNGKSTDDGNNKFDKSGDDDGDEVDEITALMARIQAMRSDISRIDDPQLARKKAAELAMALAKKI